MRGIDKLAARLTRLEREVRAKATQPQLASSSIEDGAIEAYNDTDDLSMVIGKQWDGSYAAATTNGPTPPTPVAATVTAALNGLKVYWDGTFEDGVVAPMDFARVTIYAIPTVDVANFDPVVPDYAVGTFTATGGERYIVLPPDVEHTVFLVTWTTAGKFSATSVGSVGTPQDLPTLDGDPTAEPDSSPAITASGLADSIVLRSETVATSTLIEYHMQEYVDGTPFVPVAGDTATRIGIPTRSAVQVVSTTPDGVPLDPDKTYAFSTIATNIIGAADPTAEVSAKLEPGALTALILAEVVTGLVMAGQIKVGQITVDPDDGIRIPQPNGGVIHFPADGALATVTAYMIAKGMTLTGDSTFQGLISVLGQMKVAAGVTAPTAKPSMAASWEVLETWMFGGEFTEALHGLCDTADGTKWVTTESFFGGKLRFFNKTTGVYAGEASLGSQFQPFGGVTRIGSTFYAAGQHSGRSDEWWVRAYDMTGAFTGTEWWLWDAGATPKNAAIGRTSGGDVLVSYARTNGDSRVRTYTTTGTHTATRDLTGINLAVDYGGVYESEFDFGAGVSRIVTMTRTQPGSNHTIVRESAAAVRDTSRQFSRASGTWAHGMWWDGTRFWTLDGSGRIWKYAAGVPVDVVVDGAGAWYDGDASTSGSAANPPSGGAAYTHETEAGPRETFTRPARSFLTLTMPPPPEAEVTDPTKTDKANLTRIYAGPTGGTLRLQATLALGVNAVTKEALDTVTKTPETTNGFAGIGASGSLSSIGLNGDSVPTWELFGEGPGRIGPAWWDAPGDILTVDGDLTVTGVFDEQAPYGSRSKSTSQNITATATIALQTADELLDGMTWDAATNEFIVPKAGLYEFVSSATWDNGGPSTGYTSMTHQINGATSGAMRVGNNGQFGGIAINRRHRLAAGDRVRFTLNTSTGTQVVRAGASETWAQLKYIRP